MIHLDNTPIDLLIAVGKIKDPIKREMALRNWYDHHIKELTWFLESATDQFNPFSFREMAYEQLTNKMCEQLFKHPHVNIRTKFIPQLGRVRISAAVGLLKISEPTLNLDRNETEGLSLPPALLP